MLCGTATGELLPPYTVYKSGKVWTTWTEGGPQDAKYDCSKSGWFDSQTFENWFMRVFLPTAKRKSGKKVLIGDNLSCHFNELVLKKCKKHGIKFICLPPNTTHITQPLDVAFFAPLKRMWRKMLCAWKGTCSGQRNGTLPKSEFPRQLNLLWNAIMPNSSGNLRSGFRACGIVPVSIQPLLKNLPNNDRLDLQKVGAAFISFVERRRNEVTSTSIPRQRKATNIVAGLYSLSLFFHIHLCLPIVNEPVCQGRNAWSDDSSDESGAESASPDVSDEESAQSSEERNGISTNTNDESVSLSAEDNNHVVFTPPASVHSRNIPGPSTSDQSGTVVRRRRGKPATQLTKKACPSKPEIVCIMNFSLYLKPFFLPRLKSLHSVLG